MESTRPDNLKLRGNEKGTTSRIVAENARRLRGELDLRSVSARLRNIGWPISVAALSRLENGDRRIDVDDLMALAVALNVSPVQLLIPRDGDERSPVATGIPPEVNAVEARAWMREVAGLSHQDRIDYWVDQQRIWSNQVRHGEERPDADEPRLREMAERHLRNAYKQAAEASRRLEELLALGGSVD